MEGKIIFDAKFLKHYCDENGITLLETYNKCNRDTVINGKCIEPECTNNFSKKFNAIIKSTGAYCVNCTKKHKVEKSKKTNIERYGTDNPMKSKEINKKSRETLKKKIAENPQMTEEIKKKKEQTNMERHGVAHPFNSEKSRQTCREKYGHDYATQSEEMKEKSRKTCIENFGVEYSMQSEEVKEKSRKTCMEKYGVDNAYKSEEIKEKIKKTNYERYGTTNPMELQKFKDKFKQSHKDKYGVEYPIQHEEFRKKMEDANLERYGCKNVFQSEEIKEKSKKTCMEKYGTQYAMQNPKIVEKAFHNAYRLKDYIMPSGDIRRVQGYEIFALDDLVEHYEEEDIITDKALVPEVWYIDEEEIRHRYFVDIYIPSENLCIEVKSEYTLTLIRQIKKNKFKFIALIEAGYRCEIWIYNPNGTRNLILDSIEELETYFEDNMKESEDSVEENDEV